MTTFSIEFAAEVEMNGDHSHPPVLTTRIRPNLVVAGNYCLCFVTETVPSEGIAAGSHGTFKAMAVCAAEDADRFTPNGPFELRDGPHVFAKGRISTIFSRVENQSTP